MCVGALDTDNDCGGIAAEPAHGAATSVDFGLGFNRGGLCSFLLRGSLCMDVLCRTGLVWIPTASSFLGLCGLCLGWSCLPDRGYRGVASVVSNAKFCRGNRVLQNRDRTSGVVCHDHLRRKHESGRVGWNSRELIGRCLAVNPRRLAGGVAFRAWAGTLVRVGGRRWVWYFCRVVSRSLIVITKRGFFG